jgi:hypothetical protein
VPQVGAVVVPLNFRLLRPQRKGVAVDERLLNSYVVTYELGRASIAVSRVGKALAFQQNGQSTITELLADTPTRFFLRGGNIAVSFEGDGGSIDRLVVEAGGQRQVATRRK